MPGKIVSPTLKKLEEKFIKDGGTYKEYPINDFFLEIPVSKKLTKFDIEETGTIPIISSDSNNNGIMGFCNKRPTYIVNEKTPIYLAFGDHTRTMNIIKDSFCVADNVKVLVPLNNNINVLLYIIAVWKKRIPNLGYARHWSKAKNVKLLLPTNKYGKIDFEFMENYILKLKDEYAIEIEKECKEKVDAYINVSKIKNFILTYEEQKVISDFNNIQWSTYNLKKLFGQSTRGKRLKSADRIKGELPFVTAGEVNDGISDYIANDVQIFSKNTITIDMFGSAKYRNYEYGGDDHVAVVHTENLSKNATLFITSAIHKSSHNGQFDYSRNFYAKDADNLEILLPSKNGNPDFVTMETIISAVHKMVIKDVILNANNKIEATKHIIKEG